MHNVGNVHTHAGCTFINPHNVQRDTSEEAAAMRRATAIPLRPVPLGSSKLRIFGTCLTATSPRAELTLGNLESDTKAVLGTSSVQATQHPSSLHDRMAEAMVAGVLELQN